MTRSPYIDDADGACLRCLDILWLLHAGENLDQTARRLGTQRDSLLVHANRHGVDLSRWLAAERELSDARRLEDAR